MTVQELTNDDLLKDYTTYTRAAVMDNTRYKRTREVLKTEILNRMNKTEKKETSTEHLVSGYQKEVIWRG